MSARYVSYAEHVRRSPDKVTEEELRQYFLYLANEKKVARSTSTIALCGIKFFYQHTLRRDWPTLRIVRPAREYKLPVVLSREEVRRVSGGSPHSCLPRLSDDDLQLRAAADRRRAAAGRRYR